MERDMFSIEKLKEKDIIELKELYDDAFEGSASDFQKMKNTFNQIKDNSNYIILCAKAEGKIVGSVLGIICPELFGQGKPFMVLEDVAVLQQYRRKGIAKQLLISIEDYARSRDCNMIIFVSSAHHTDAHKLYESLGFGEDKVNGYRKRLK